MVDADYGRETVGIAVPAISLSPTPSSGEEPMPNSTPPFCVVPIVAGASLWTGSTGLLLEDVIRSGHLTINGALMPVLTLGTVAADVLVCVCAFLVPDCLTRLSRRQFGGGWAAFYAISSTRPRGIVLLRVRSGACEQHRVSILRGR